VLDHVNHLRSAVRRQLPQCHGQVRGVQQPPGPQRHGGDGEIPVVVSGRHCVRDADIDRIEQSECIFDG
jgi:DNA-nicking Smr family endonuclease